MHVCVCMHACVHACVRVRACMHVCMCVLYMHAIKEELNKSGPTFEVFIPNLDQSVSLYKTREKKHQRHVSKFQNCVTLKNKLHSVRRECTTTVLGEEKDEK